MATIDQKERYRQRAALCYEIAASPPIELQELRKMPFLSDIGRETADKAERLFTFINSRFSA
jgi:hypothetical protein